MFPEAHTAQIQPGSALGLSILSPPDILVRQGAIHIKLICKATFSSQAKKKKKKVRLYTFSWKQVFALFAKDTIDANSPKEGW